MSNKNRLMLLFAVVLAGVAAWFANSWIQNQQVTNVEKIESVKVVISTMDINYGQELGEKHLRLVDWPKELLPPGYFSDPNELLGRISKKNIAQGAVFNQDWVVEHLEGSRLAALIDGNKRAVAVRVDDVVGVAGFILPGNRVDVIGVKKKPKGYGVNVETVLENVKVLAVDQDVSPDVDKPKVVRSITLELTPSETEVIVQASHEGKIQISLRNPKETVPQIAKAPEPKVEEKKKLIPLLKPSVPPRHGIEKVTNNPGSFEPMKVTIIRGLDISKEDTSIE